MKDKSFFTKRIIGILSVTVCIALIATASVSVVSNIRKKAKAEQERENQLASYYQDKVAELESEKEALNAEISSLDDRYSKFLDSLAASNSDYFNLLKQYEELNKLHRFYSGLTPVQGAGLRIFLDDGETLDGKVTSYMIVHDSTLIRIVNSLRSAGAQAVSINDERIVSMTDIVCVGPSIRVNGKKLFSPFEISAIGPADTLYDKFITGDVYASISYSDLKCDVEKLDSLTIAEYAGAYEKDSNLLVGK